MIEPDMWGCKKCNAPEKARSQEGCPRENCGLEGFYSVELMEAILEAERGRKEFVDIATEIVER